MTSLTAEQLALLIEIMDTPGITVPVPKCKLVYETHEALTAAWQKAVEAEAKEQP